MNRSIMILIFSLVTVHLKAQEIKIGVKGGFSSYWHDYVLPDYSQHGEPEYYSHQGFNAGIFSTIDLSKRFTFQPEIVYSEKGSYDRDLPFNFEMDYVDIPLLIRLNLGSFSVYTGPQFGFLLEAREDDLGEMTDAFNGIALAALFGVQVDFGFGLILGARIEEGLNDYSNLDDDDIVQFNNGIKNKGAQIYAGWKVFKLK